jgi:hypothetical protein
VRIDTRWAAGDAERIRKYAAEFVAMSLEVLLVTDQPPITSTHAAEVFSQWT